MASERHHYVPQFYLSYFASTRYAKHLTLWVYDKKGGHPRLQTPRNTAVEGDFYSFRSETGDTDNSLEKRFSRVESVAKPILDRWQKPAAIPTTVELEKIAVFLAVMYARGPWMLQFISESMEIRALELAKFNALKPNLPQLIEKWRARRGAQAPALEEVLDRCRNFEKYFRIVIKRKGYPPEIVDLLVPYVLRELLTMQWHLYPAPSNTFFVTGDTPLCVFAPTGHKKAILGFGFKLPNLQISFPISPKLLLLIDRLPPTDHTSVNGDFVCEMNRRTAAISERIVVSSELSPDIADLTERYCSTLHRPKIDKSVLSRTVAEQLRARAKDNPDDV
jgi:Protein of unknown function (DUF4238)